MANFEKFWFCCNFKKAQPILVIEDKNVFVLGCAGKCPLKLDFVYWKQNRHFRFSLTNLERVIQILKSWYQNDCKETDFYFNVCNLQLPKYKWIGAHTQKNIFWSWSVVWVNVFLHLIRMYSLQNLRNSTALQSSYFPFCVAKPFDLTLKRFVFSEKLDTIIKRLFEGIKGNIRS